jgi:hypothetical protein
LRKAFGKLLRYAERKNVRGGRKLKQRTVCVSKEKKWNPTAIDGVGFPF